MYTTFSFALRCMEKHAIIDKKNAYGTKKQVVLIQMQRWWGKMYLKTCRICMCAQCAYWVQCRERLLLMHQRNSKMHEMAHLVFATSECMHTPAVAHCTLSSLLFAYREKWFIVCAVRRIVHTMQEIPLTSIYILNSAKSYVNELIVIYSEMLWSPSPSPFTVTILYWCYFYYYWQPNLYFIKWLYFKPLYYII